MAGYHQTNRKIDTEKLLTGGRFVDHFKLTLRGKYMSQPIHSSFWSSAVLVTEVWIYRLNQTVKR